MKNLRIAMSFFVAATIFFTFVQNITAQGRGRPEVFEKIEILEPQGDNLRETDVRVRFGEDSLVIESTGGGTLRTFKYSTIRSLEYSYTKSPRWKTGLGLGAASILFPPMLFIAIPLGFTKHRRHWITIRSENDYAVLKISKSIRKVFIPSLETHTNVRVDGLGENK